MDERKDKIAKQIYSLIARVPQGRLTTYGAIARVLSISPRLVGYYLHHNPNPQIYPCHRVVRSDGKIASGFAFGGQAQQTSLLKGEGIKVKRGKVDDLGQYLIDLS